MLLDHKTVGNNGVTKDFHNKNGMDVNFMDIEAILLIKFLKKPCRHNLEKQFAAKKTQLVYTLTISAKQLHLLPVM